MPRIESDNIVRGEPIDLTVDGTRVTAFSGETLATVLLAKGHLAFNKVSNQTARAPYCNMGTCFECQVRVASTQTDSHRWLRACLVPAEDGMSIMTGQSRQVLGETKNED